MGIKALNPRRVKRNRNYEISEIAKLFGAHRQTIKGWVRAGLPVLEGTYPRLIFGEDLFNFLVARRASARRPCAPSEMYCVSCKMPRRVAGDMADFIHMSARSGQLRAFCEECGHMMYRFASAATVEAEMPGVDVKFVSRDVSLRQCSEHRSNCTPAEVADNDP